ncbi:sigma-70 family RNA polymerase sigma factor [Sphingomonas sp. PL-96]|uniref:sigma-70 family RNA polymerase sigma factor n=1 Tax=Sphingomonas sp. PL-96 TaxID=2887201 RepID=UPI001E394B8E|nr:sigma-70 family RNA polymerase sigma factor [Sphingomonas sp. PL-96]MCC2978234.1 sigma-70 family RNA polymerase sigma factor [Sphingomonas sp. PL-96]
MGYEAPILGTMTDSLRASFEVVWSLPRELQAVIDRLGPPDAGAADRAFGHDLAGLRPRLQSYARSLSREDELADDLVQETMLRAWAARMRFQPGTSLRAWTFTILRNTFLSQCRRGRFVADYDEIDAEHRLAQPASQTAIAELSEVADLIDALPIPQREALRLVAVEGLSYEQAAERSGISLGTMKSRVSRARVALKATLDGVQSSTVSTSVEPVQAVVERISEPIRKSGKLRRAWADAKAEGRPLLIG